MMDIVLFTEGKDSFEDLLKNTQDFLLGRLMVFKQVLVKSPLIIVHNKHEAIFRRNHIFYFMKMFGVHVVFDIFEQLFIKHNRVEHP